MTKEYKVPLAQQGCNANAAIPEDQDVVNGDGDKEYANLEMVGV